MPIRVQAPDGTIVEFPDGTSDDVMANAMRRTFSAPAPSPAVATPSGRHLSFEEGRALVEQDDAGGMFGAGVGGLLEGVPVVGPAIMGGAKRAAAGLSSLIGGGSYDENLTAANQIYDAAKEQNPATSTTAQIAGAVGSMIPAGSTALGARALGITGPSLAARVGASAGSGAAISGADTAARGGEAKDIINNTLIGGGIGGAIPALGAGISAGVRGVGNAIAPRISALFSPAEEAARRVGTALSRDTAASPAGVISSADEAVAQANNIPLVNADRGGEVTRALARSAANQSPEARAAIDKTASDRFGTQSQRAIDMLRRVTGGNVDDLAFQENLSALARATNRPAYEAAENAAEAQFMFSPRMQQLMQSPTFRRAVDDVPKRSADRGALEGFKEIANPFEQNSAGAYVIRRNADGSLVAPNLRFWDQVQRNLRSEMDTAFRSGDKEGGTAIKNLRNALLEDVDATVPAFKKARQGAASFFGAEDALEAGRMFANTPRGIPEATKAVAKFNSAEKKAFATGYASELVDKIRASGDRTNVINTVFKSQASRESVELALGAKQAREVEAYVRVEDLADKLRGSLGNSTTARQLVELGLGGGAGYFTTGDIQGALGGALAIKGARYLGERADAKVMESVANLLTQNSPGALQSAVALASQNPSYMRALERLSTAVAPASRTPATSPQIYQGAQ